MNKNVRNLILIVLALVVVVGGGVLIYNWLAEKQSPPVAEPPAGQNGGEAGANAAPNFTVYDADENPYELSDFTGEPVVLNFWATWCGYCKVEMPYFQTAYEQYGGEFTFMFINADEQPAVATAYTDEEGFTFPVYYDFGAEAGNNNGVYGFPTTIFIDSNGEIFEKHTGMMSEEDLFATLEALAEHEQQLAG